MNSIFYIINYVQLIKNHLMCDLKQPKLIAYLQALMNPVVAIYTDFIAFKKASFYKMNHNSQVCYLRKVVNDSFDQYLRRIEIRNARILEPNWIYHPEDNKPNFIYNPEDNKPKFLYHPGDLVGDGVDFTVIVPIVLKPRDTLGLIAFETKMKGLIDYYKLYSKNYKIIYE